MALLSPRVESASGLVLEWLHGEHEYQFGKNRITHQADPRASIDYIMRTELANKWQRFRFFRREFVTSPDARVYMQGGQQLLKAVGAARGALVWNGVTQGQKLQAASRASFALLGRHFDAVAAGARELPDTRLLDHPFEEAIAPASTAAIEGQYQILPVYLALGSHAINHLLDEEAAARGMHMILPRPGVPSGTIEPWQ